MPDEIEAKVKVDGFAAVRRRLAELGARRIANELETNTFFDTPDRALIAGGKGLRLREARNAETGQTSHVITFKGPQGKGELKNRQEIEFTADDGSAAAELLGAIGFVRVLSFQKRRETWELADCEVVLDELPILGTFVEIEGPDEPTVLRMRQELGLGGRPLIPTSYATMLARELEQTRDRRTAITF